MANRPNINFVLSDTYFSSVSTNFALKTDLTTIANLSTINNNDTVQPDGHYKITLNSNATINAGGRSS